MRVRGDGAILVGINSIAEFFGVHHDTIRRWIRRYGLPAVRMPNGRWMTHRSMLYAWMLNSGQKYLEAWKDQDIKVGVEKVVRLGFYQDDLDELHAKLKRKWGIDINTDPRVKQLIQLMETSPKYRKTARRSLSTVEQIHE